MKTGGKKGASREPMKRVGLTCHRSCRVGVFFIIGFLLHASMVAYASEFRVFYVVPDAARISDTSGYDGVFTTIGEAVAEVQPGDTVVIGPGVFREQIILSSGGTRDRPVTIRAEYPGWAELRGSIRLCDWQPHSRLENVYGTRLAEPTTMVYELDTGIDYREVASLQVLNREPGSFFYSADEAVLYVHPSVGGDMDRHLIEASVMDYGIVALDPPVFGARSPQITGVVIEGLVISGYSKGGVYLANAVQCEVIDCIVYRCRRGIFFRNALSSRISGCRVFSCHDPFHREMGNIGMMGYIADCVLENNTVYDTRSHGIRFYGGWYGSRMLNNLAFDSRIGLQVKGYALERDGASHYLREFPAADELAEGLSNIIKGNVVHRATGSSGLYPSIFSRYERNTAIPASSGSVRDRALNLELQPGDVADAGFADPFYHDLRLQADSPWRGTADGGADPGFREFDGSVIYVGPGGSDDAAGTSVSSAWKTLQVAFDRLAAGQTLYILPGEYGGGLKIGDIHAAVDEPTRIRAFGGGVVVIDGGGSELHGLLVDNCTNLELEGLTIHRTGSAALVLRDSRNVLIQECRFYDNDGDGIRFSGQCESVALVTTIILDNGEAGVAVAGTCERLRLLGSTVRGNAVQIELGGGLPGALQSDYNNIGDGPIARVGEQIISHLQVWRELTAQDNFSGDFAPGFVAESRRDFTLRPDSLSRGRGYLGKPVGTTRVAAAAEAPLRFAGVTVLDVRPDAADIVWSTPGHNTTRLVAYGTQPDELDNLVAYDLAFHFGRFHAVTLTDLDPGQRYFFRVGNRELIGDSHPFHYYRYLWPERGLAWQQSHYEQLDKEDTFDPVLFSFVTPAGIVINQGREFHVSPDGDDAAAGTRNEPWQSLHRACEMARAGDHIIIHDGVYRETIQPQRSGAPGAPITFAAAPGARVEIDGGREIISSAVNLTGRSHIVISGLYFFGQSEDGPFHRDNGQVLIVDSSDIMITGCVFDSRMNWADALRIYRSEEVVVEDNVFISHHGAVKATDNRGTIDFNHNTFLGPTQNKIYAVRNGVVSIRNNIFTENLFPTKKLQYRVVVLGNESLIMDHNCYILDPANDERRFIDYGGPALALDEVTALPEGMAGMPTRVGIKGTLEQWVSDFGQGKNSVVVVGDPGWAEPDVVRMVRVRRRGWPNRDWDFPRFDRSGAALGADSPLFSAAAGGLPLGARMEITK